MTENSLFTTDAKGRTPLFYAAERGNQEEVERMIFSLSGTGVCCQRLSLISKKDNEGLTASDLAEREGHLEVAKLLRSEQMRMEFFE